MGGFRGLTITNSEAETFALGEAFGKELKPNSVVCFFGDLGAGKTTFIKGVVAGAADYPPALVSSPTFVYLNIYKGSKTIYHFDLYRLHDAEEFLSMGFDEVFFAEGICCIEWSERIMGLLPQDCIRVELAHEKEMSRRIVING